MSGDGPKRPWLAGLAGLAYPGLGHVYLREWIRALLWFGLMLMSGSLLIDAGAVPETLTVESLMQFSRNLPTGTLLGLSAIQGLSAVDAYRMATARNRRLRQASAGVRCPNCGRDVDSDLDFCHWCTTELPGVEEKPSTDAADHAES